MQTVDILDPMVEVRRGRPRSESTRRAILEATRDILVETGYEAMTIEAIAARAKAGKQTIYRWWPSKSFIVADAVSAGLLNLPTVTVPHTESLDSDLKSWIASVTTAMNDSQGMSVIRALVNTASDDTHEAVSLYGQVTGPHHAALIARLRSGQHEGQLSPSVDALAVTDALIGTVLFGILARLPTQGRLSAVVDALLRGDSARHPLVGAPGDSA